ncbi:hypothetical protein DLE01_12020, partial [Streptomyces sp. FT05W]
YESVNTPLVGYLNNAIKAKELFKKDKDYVVIDGEVMIVDELPEEGGGGRPPGTQTAGATGASQETKRS